MNQIRSILGALVLLFVLATNAFGHYYSAYDYYEYHVVTPEAAADANTWRPINSAEHLAMVTNSDVWVNLTTGDYYHDYDNDYQTYEYMGSIGDGGLFSGHDLDTASYMNGVYNYVMMRTGDSALAENIANQPMTPEQIEDYIGMQDIE